MTANNFTFRMMQDKMAEAGRRLDRLDKRTPSFLWRTYTPTVTGTVSNPNLGASGATYGRDIRVGDTVTTWGSAAWGGAGIAAGSGDYQVSVPFPRTSASAGTNLVLGSAGLFNGAATWAFFTAVIITAGTSYFNIAYQAAWPTGALTMVGAAAPWAWNTAGMVLAWSIQYEAAAY